MILLQQFLPIVYYMNLEKYLLIAKEAAEYAKSLISLGSSNKPNSNITHYDILKLKEELNKSTKNNRYKSSLKRLKSKVDIISKYQIGNCYEHTVLAYYYVITKFKVKASMIDLKNIDHCFLLLGAEDSSEFHKWGDSAVVCDPWDNRYYPAKFALIFLKFTFNYILHLSIKNAYQIADNNLPNNIELESNNAQALLEMRQKVNFVFSYDFATQDLINPLKYSYIFVAPTLFSFVVCNILNGNTEFDFTYGSLLFAIMASYAFVFNSLMHNVKQQNMLKEHFSI